MDDKLFDDWDDVDDPQLKRDADWLGQRWLKAAMGDAEADAEIAAFVARDTRPGAPMAALSAAYHVVVDVVVRHPFAEARVALAQQIAVVEATRWRRAHQLLAAGLAYQLAADSAQAAESLAQLNRVCPPDDPSRPPLERFWSEHSAAVLLCNVGDYEAALHRSMVCQRIAHELGALECLFLADALLSYLFLLVGDIEGALAVLPRAAQRGARLGRSGRSTDYNLMLAHVVTGQYSEAAALLIRHPKWLGPAFLGGNPSMRCLAALVAAWEGRHGEARAILARATLDPGADDLPPLAANRAWVRGQAWLLLKAPDRAAAEVRSFLALAEARSDQISPMNRTQMLRVLGEALEATGDLRGSLDALKQSQAACFRWATQSVRSRLLAMSLEDSGADESRLQRRLDAVSQAAERAESGSRQAETSRVLAHVTHEMRNPLNGVIGMTSLLALSALDERQRRYLQVAQSSAQMLLALCNDLLDLAKIESGRFSINRQPIAVAALLDEVCQVYQPQAAARSVSLSLSVDAGMPAQLELDRLRLQQVLMNLVGNATKFTLAGAITVTAQWRPGLVGHTGWLRVAVTDTGPGLSAAQLPRLFQEFSQADETVAQRHGGTGLGLALCKGLVGLMGGRIDVDSEPGRGSTFWFEIPTHRPGADEAGPHPTAGKPDTTDAAWSRDLGPLPPAARPGRPHLHPTPGRSLAVHGGTTGAAAGETRRYLGMPGETCVVSAARLFGQ